MKIKDIQESTVAGSIASVAKPLGELQTRSKPEKAPKVTKGKKYANTISEGAVKELLHNLKYMDADEFQKVYKKSKEFFQKADKPIGTTRPSATSSKTGSQVWHDTGYTDKKAAAQAKEEPIQEDELKEEDLIILPGMLRGKDKSFISKEHDRRDHEVEMARSDVYAAAKDAMRIFKILENRTEDDGLMGWQQSYITLASDYLNSVADSLEYDSISNEGAASAIITKLAQKGAKNLPKTPETQRAVANRAMELEKNFNRVATAGAAGAGAAAAKAVYDKKTNEGAGVIAGGMSNFEEDSVNEISDFKKNELEFELRNEPKNNYQVNIDGKRWKVFGDKQQAENIARSLVRKGKKATVHITGAGISEEQAPMFTPESKLDEKKGVVEGHADQQRKIFKKNGKPVGEVGIDRESSPGVGQWYMKCYAYDIDRSGYDSYGEAVAELKHCLKQGVAEAYDIDDTNYIDTLYQFFDLAYKKQQSPEHVKYWMRLLREPDNPGERKFAGKLKNALKLAKDSGKFSDNAQAMIAIAKAWRKKHLQTDGFPDELVEKQIDEKKDACYNKVKSRYKVWPSAYASGALSKCRKVGAGNWGNKSKK